MARAVGIGGIFFKSKDAPSLKAWYQRNLGLPISADPRDPGVSLPWRERDPPGRERLTVWAPFSQETTYFQPSTASFMVNFIVDDLDGMLTQLREAGAQVSDKIEADENGRFGWAMDPEGNRIELWEPPGEG